MYALHHEKRVLEWGPDAFQVCWPSEPDIPWSHPEHPTQKLLSRNTTLIWVVYFCVRPPLKASDPLPTPPPSLSLPELSSSLPQRSANSKIIKQQGTAVSRIQIIPFLRAESGSGTYAYRERSLITFQHRVRQHKPATLPLTPVREHGGLGTLVLWQLVQGGKAV